MTVKQSDLSFGETEALVRKIGGRRGVEKLLSGEWIVGEPAEVQTGDNGASGEIVADLLERSTASIPVSAADRFIAREKFAVGEEKELAVSYVGDDFIGHFLDLVEENVPAATLHQYRLLESSIDAPIFAALGGQESAMISLSHVFEFLKSADRSRWYFFYVSDVAGDLWALDAYWRDNGWDIETYSVTYPRGWRGGGRVVSR